MTTITVQYTESPEFEVTVDEQIEFVVEVGDAIFVPPSSGSTVEYVVTVASDNWIWNHNLGYRPVGVVLNPAGEEVGVAVTHISVNTLRVDFNVPSIGRIVVR